MFLPGSEFSNYHIVLIGHARKNLQKIPAKERTKLLEKLDLLIKNYNLLDIKKLQDFQTLYRIKCGNYRIVYSKQIAEQTFLVALICHRQDVYKQLKNFVGMFR